MLSGKQKEQFWNGGFLVTEPIGSNVKSHHTKINSKLPVSATIVKWHQGFPFTHNSNNDLITALLRVGEDTAENGALKVIPGSHKGKIHGLWQ